MKQRRDEGFVRSELDDSHFVVAVIVASCWVSFSAGTYPYCFVSSADQDLMMPLLSLQGVPYGTEH